MSHDNNPLVGISCYMRWKQTLEKQEQFVTRSQKKKSPSMFLGMMEVTIIKPPVY